MKDQHLKAAYSVLPHHVAIIMDGNGRWAQARGLGRVLGHRQGALAVRRTVEEAARLGIGILTLFAFSSENWKRPQAEVQALMSLFVRTLRSEQDNLRSHDIRTRVVGDVAKFPDKLREAITEVEDATASCGGMRLNIAANYGGRADIMQAVCRLMAERSALAAPPDEAVFTSLLQVPEDVDLIIRTGGERRLSNFLLWQAAYGELFFSPTLWPDFGADDLHEALQFFASRERRFGMTSAQVRGH